jgi:hypothetical protein
MKTGFITSEFKNTCAITLPLFPPSLVPSLAQIFNELGNGVILRGMPVQLDKTDRKPHFSTEQATLLLDQTLNEYNIALNNFPDRLFDSGFVEKSGALLLIG